jgi:hypothetical protein
MLIVLHCPLRIIRSENHSPAQLPTDALVVNNLLRAIKQKCLLLHARVQLHRGRVSRRHQLEAVEHGRF